MKVGIGLEQKIVAEGYSAILENNISPIFVDRIEENSWLQGKNSYIGNDVLLLSKHWVYRLIKSNPAQFMSCKERIISVDEFGGDGVDAGLLRMGLGGFLKGFASCHELVCACRLVGEGSRYVCSSTLNNLVQNLSDEREKSEIDKDCIKLLTERELQIAKMITKQMSSKTIASELGISLGTVNRHRNNIIAKLRIKNSKELVNYIKN